MTAALMRESADMLELLETRTFRHGIPLKSDSRCMLCNSAWSTDKIPHKPDCLITRLRSAADQMEGMAKIVTDALETHWHAATDEESSKRDGRSPRNAEAETDRRNHG